MNFPRSYILCFYLGIFPFIATSFIDERFIQNTQSLEAPYGERRITGQTFPLTPSSQVASTSASPSLIPNLKGKHQIQREDIERDVGSKAIIPDLNEPYIDDSAFPLSEWHERGIWMSYDGLDIPLPQNNIASKNLSSNDEHDISELCEIYDSIKKKNIRMEGWERADTSTFNKDSRNKYEQVPALPQRVMIAPSRIAPQYLIAPESKPLDNDSFIGNGNDKVDRSEITSMLQWQSKLALGKKFGLSEDIKAHFENLTGSTISKLPDQLKHIEYDKQIKMAFERIRTSFVLGFLASLKVMYEGESVFPLMVHLLDDGWNFLKNYLHHELTNLDHEELLKSIQNTTKIPYYFLIPGNLMAYALYLSKKSILSPRLVFKVLGQWAESSTYKESLSKTLLDYDQFLIKCSRLFQERGEGKGVTKRKKRQDSTESQALGNSIVHCIDSNIRSQSFPTRIVGINFCRSIKRFGKNIIEAHQSETITQFFEELSGRILDVYKMKANSAYQSLNYSTNRASLNLHILELAMKIAECSVTPSFIGLIGLMHPGATMPEAWDHIFDHGWRFLKSYFSTWCRYFLDTTYPIIFDISKDTKGGIEWSNVKETIHYLSKLQPDGPVPQRPIWYLVDLWYESIKIDSNQISPNFNILPPHRENMKNKCMDLDNQFFSSYLKRKNMIEI